MEPHSHNKQDLLRPELFFLLQKFLSASPLQETYKALTKELEEQKILPKRIDWEGKQHDRTFNDLERLYPHIGSNHLLDICARIGTILDKEIPPTVPGVQSLLGSGRQSILRTSNSILPKLNLRHYATRKHGMPISDPYLPHTHHNITNVLVGREMSGQISRCVAMSPMRYSQLQIHRKTFGHLSPVYCLLFDSTGRYVITGADDMLVKLWCAYSGKLVHSFRGALSEISDISVNVENTLMAAGLISKVLKVWDLQTGAPVCVLTGHTGTITSVNFCPSGTWGTKYIATTSYDGSVGFFTYSHAVRDKPVFASKPIFYQEKMRPGQSQMICAAFSPGGCFLAAGSADHHVRVYGMRSDEGPTRIFEMEVHTDRVDSIAWAHRGLRFVSGSKDGTAFIWRFEQQQWKYIQLCMTTRLPNTMEVSEEPKKLSVTMVAWEGSNNFVVTAVGDNCLKVWKSTTGELMRVLTGHSEGIFVLEPHPKEPYVLLSCGHDGQIFIWDILRGTQVAHFQNESSDPAAGAGAIYDAKWSSDGTMFSACDSLGHILTYGFGNGSDRMKMLPRELFFHTDYRPLVIDPDAGVLDEQTQVAPHLMPPPFLVDKDGNPYPPKLQRLVPGREHCASEQLVPNIVIGTGGRQEVIQGIADAPRSDIDRMIAALAQRQNRNEENEGEEALPPRSIRNTFRGTADAGEGVRRSTGEWQQDPNMVWNKNYIVPPLRKSEIQKARQFIENIAALETAEYQKEIKRRPLMINTASTSSPIKNIKDKRKRRNGIPARHTRAHSSNNEAEPEQNVDIEHEESNNSSSNNSDDSSAKDLSLSDSSSDSEESSGYSDWVADQGVNLEPPKRSKRKSAHRKIVDGEDDADDDDEFVNHASSSHSKTKAVPKFQMGEVPDIYKQLEWLSETIPRKAPYCPQMGDEVVYFIQGHRMYINAVKMKKVYKVYNRDLPWTKHDLKDHEFVKIVGIKYDIRPPRLCCLKLALLDDEHKLTDKVFTIRYHDMADVLDFFVLIQTYETAISRTWSEGDKFRCMIDDGWWVGKISSKSSLSDEYPDSLFMCYEIQWDNGEAERMSPWDLEPIREDRLPETVGEAVPVLPDEIQSILYQPTMEEWPRGDRNTTCRRIISGLDKMMELAIAEPFLAPVDLNLYPSYSYLVEYPVDLSMIKARFENHFYRRIASAQFDVRYLACNAEKFNVPHSKIVKNARIITDLCLRIIKSSTEDIDVQAIYHQMVDTYESSCSEEDPETFVSRPGPSNVTNQRPTRALTTRNAGVVDWRVEANKLLNKMLRTEDSVPFRTPVDRIKHPDYYQMVDTPMDLGTVREDLVGGNYDTPLEFAKDMRLIFQNSKIFNTNQRSTIYMMTMQLSALFEANIKNVINAWRRTTLRKGRTLRKGSRRVATSSTASALVEESDSDNSEKENKEMAVQSNKRRTLRNTVNSNSKMPLPPASSDDDDDDDSDVDVENVATQGSGGGACSGSSGGSQKTANDARRRISSSESSDAASQLGAESSSSEAGSDCEPLSKYAKSQRNRHRKRRKLTSSSSGNDSDDSDRKTLRPRNSKRRKKCINDDDDDSSNSSDSSDNVPLAMNRRLANSANNGRNNHNHNLNDDNEDEDDDDDDRSDSRVVTTVSSRGRVRKMTERARVFLGKS